MCGGSSDGIALCQRLVVVASADVFHGCGQCPGHGSHVRRKCCAHRSRHQAAVDVQSSVCWRRSAIVERAADAAHVLTLENIDMACKHAAIHVGGARVFVR